MLCTLISPIGLMVTVRAPWHCGPIIQVEWMPPKGPYDPRLLMTGQWDDKENRWLRGLMDQDSFVETLGGYGTRDII